MSVSVLSTPVPASTTPSPVDDDDGAPTPSPVDDGDGEPTPSPVDDGDGAPTPSPAPEDPSLGAGDDSSGGQATALLSASGLWPLVASAAVVVFGTMMV